jgi:Flp pilus assembly protein TadG
MGSRKSVRARTIRRRSGRAAEPGSEAGQSLVEFSLILFPLFLILLAIIQFGFIFSSYVTMTNAARDAARIGTIYVYDADSSKLQNDVDRNEAIKDSVLASMSMLGKTAPWFTTGSTWSQSGTTCAPVFTEGDLVISYVVPVCSFDSDTRSGQQVTVQATYHQDLVVPLISNFLPKDAGGRLTLTGVVTMVIN